MSTIMLNFASAEDEALTREPDCQHEELDCEHAEHWHALELSLADWFCERCVYAWSDGSWHTEELCRACGIEDRELWLAGM